MTVPKLTHLQFLILGMLLGGTRSGKSIRAELDEGGSPKSGPSFYQIMARLEDEGFVGGWYDQKVVEGQIIRERHYEVTALGRATWQGTRDFYQATIGRYGDDPLPV